MRAEIEESEAAIRSRLELLGEDPAALESVLPTFDTTKMAAIVRKRDPALVRLRARWSQVIGYLWLMIGARTRALSRFEVAAALRPGWVAPVLTAAMIHARDMQSAQALASFRRALELDRHAVEANPLVVRVLAQSFLRRAEAVERDGRGDIAYGLLQEVLALDLRKAPSGLRFALSERLEGLRGRVS
jgi:tetratricopeptide (TPR) repeat protein